MTFTPLTAEQMEKWNFWLQRSHGLTCWAVHTVYHCDIDFPLFLTPLLELPRLELRQERETEGLLASFALTATTCTIANLWGETGLDLSKIRRPGDFPEAKDRLRDAARQGRVWWGTEWLLGFPDLTSICYVFDPGVVLPRCPRQTLQEDLPVTGLDTSLNLI